jgi:hypothetical protein
MAETLRRDGSSGQARMWIVVVSVYLILLAVCLMTISLLVQSWTGRVALILTIVALYNLAFTLISSTLGVLSSDFTDGMTSANLRDFLSSNFYTLSVAFVVAGAGFQTALFGGTESESSGQGRSKRPRLAGLTSVGAALLVVAYAIVHMVFICPLTYLFYVPGSHFLNVVLASPVAHRALLQATEGEDDSAGSSTRASPATRQEHALDVVETLREKQTAFQNLFATALAGFAGLALEVI